MDSGADVEFCNKIASACDAFGVRCILRVASAHKGTAETLKIVAEFEGMCV